VLPAFSANATTRVNSSSSYLVKTLSSMMSNQVVEVLRADCVGDDRVGEERDERSEEQRIDKDDEPGTHQVPMPRIFEFAIDPREKTPRPT
jgi:hypothetical protein